MINAREHIWMGMRVDIRQKIRLKLKNFMIVTTTHTRKDLCIIYVQKLSNPSAKILYTLNSIRHARMYVNFLHFVWWPVMVLAHFNTNIVLILDQ